MNQSIFLPLYTASFYIKFHMMVNHVPIFFLFSFIWIINTTASNIRCVCVWVCCALSDSMNEFLAKCSYICFVAGIEMDFNFMTDEALLMSVICSNWVNNEWPLCLCVCVSLNDSEPSVHNSFPYSFSSLCSCFFWSLEWIIFLMFRLLMNEQSFRIWRTSGS